MNFVIFKIGINTEETGNSVDKSVERSWKICKTILKILSQNLDKDSFKYNIPYFFIILDISTNMIGILTRLKHCKVTKSEIVIPKFLYIRA